MEFFNEKIYNITCANSKTLILILLFINIFIMMVNNFHYSFFTSILVCLIQVLSIFVVCKTPNPFTCSRQNN